MKEESFYRPVNVELMSLAGLCESLLAMRLPHNSQGYSSIDEYKEYELVDVRDLELAKKLVLAGDEHAKAIRGIIVYLKIQMQIGFMVEFETYRIGCECLSTTSTMHTDLKKLSGIELAEKKQEGLSDVYYTRIVMMNYQALRRIYFQRKTHRHPDWKIFCDFIVNLPYSHYLINPEEY